MLIHQIFENQVHKTPSNLAVTFENHSLSYFELNQKANQLAHFLQRKGISSETLVAISMTRSIDMIIAILGVLKAGGAYVPLDPTFPKHRCDFILKDTGNPLLLTNCQDQFAHYPNAISREKVWSNANQLSTANPDSKVKDQNLAYIIYTSGSSGEPKGVLIEHKSLPNLALSQAKLFKINAESKILQFASLSFDASVSEWTTALTQGATLCIPNIGPLSVSDALAKVLEKYEYTVATIPPSVLTILPDNLIAPLKTLVIAGESNSNELIQKWKNRLYLINAYGPTEYTVCTTAFVYDNNDEEENLIGKPLPNTSLYVLDENLNPTLNGELCVSGIGQARGYLNRPDLTKSKFIPHPIEKDGSLLYRTGDHVCLLPDGNLKYLGRLDDQIKINGYRIEVNEIEKTIKQLPWIKQAIVIPRTQTSGNKQLIGFFIPENDSSTQEQMILAVKQHLKNHLPNYLIPHLIFAVKHFPLTVQGKLDKKTLLQQCHVNMTSTVFTSDQEIIAKIWQEVLELDIPSATVGFFELGGNSLLLYRLQEKLQNYFQLKFDLSEFFAYPTIESFAKFILQKQTNNFQEKQTEKHTAKISQLNRIHASRQLRLKK